MAKQRSGINRSLMWLRKALQITEETDSPQVLSEVCQPVIDVFGWERLEATEFISANAGAPASSIAGPVTPEGVIRVYLNAAVRHTDPGVDHLMWIEKLLRVTTSVIEVTTPMLALPVTVPASLDRWCLCEPGARLRGSLGVNLIAGNIVISMNFVDIPIGEYIPR